MRKCVEEIIKSKNIRKFEDFDFQTLANLKLGAAEIAQIIDAVWVRESNPYTRQIDKWMMGEDTFDPAPVSKQQWVDPHELLYHDLKHQHYKEYAFFVQSPIELWHVIYRNVPRGFSPLTHIYSISTSVIPGPQRYFLHGRTSLLSYFEEVDVKECPDLRKKRTVMGNMSSTMIGQILDRPRTKVDGPEIALLEKIESVI